MTMHGLGWDPWVRTILPEEVPVIRDDVCAIDEARVRAWAQIVAQSGTEPTPRMSSGTSSISSNELRNLSSRLRLTVGEWST